jgi:hypothetical protein
MEQIECSETSAYKIQTPGNYPEGNIQQDPNCFVALPRTDKISNFWSYVNVNIRDTKKYTKRKTNISCNIKYLLANT